jgi:hypothetical protein
VNVVVDTNVLIAANRRDTHATVACAARCARTLVEIQQQHVLLDDSELRIFNEYKKYCSFSGQPGVGDRFFRWYLQNRNTLGQVRQVDVGPDDSSMTAVLPLPLRALDPSDHKFAAVCLAGNGDRLYNATDSDWSEHSPALSDAGIQVEELCLDCEDLSRRR